MTTRKRTSSKKDNVGGDKMTVHISASLNRKLDSVKLLNAVEESTKAMTYDLYDEVQRDGNIPYDTGYLQGSVNWGGEGSKENIHAYVTIGAKYWSYLEFGTSKMNPRHWIFNSIRTVQPYESFLKYFKTYYPLQ